MKKESGKNPVQFWLGFLAGILMGLTDTYIGEFSRYLSTFLCLALFSFTALLSYHSSILPSEKTNWPAMRDAFTGLAIGSLLLFISILVGGQKPLSTYIVLLSFATSLLIGRWLIKSPLGARGTKDV